MKKRIAKRIVFYVVILLVLPVVSLRLFVAQPSIWWNMTSDRQVDPAKLRKHVERFSVDYRPRSYTDTKNLAKCVSYIVEQFTAAGGIVTTQQYKVEGREFKNIISSYGPDTKDVLVVGAHYDACGSTPGADDNASGVAGLLELAVLLGGYSNLSMRVCLVAYCTEEPPYFSSNNMGSYRHAEMMVAAGRNVKAMIALEMIGYFNDRVGSQKYPILFLYLVYPWRGNYIAVIGNPGQRKLIARVKNSMKGATELPVYSLAAPNAVPGVNYSDHMSYWRHGISAVMVTDTAFYRNDMYHGEGDTPDRLDYERMSRVVVGVFEAIKDLVQAD